MGQGRTLRIRRQLGDQHRQRIPGRAAVLAWYLEVSRRRRIRACRTPGHKGRADRGRRARAEHPGPRRVAGLRYRVVQRHATQRRQRARASGRRGPERRVAPAATAFRPVRAATARTVRSARGAAAGSPAATARPHSRRRPHPTAPSPLDAPLLGGAAARNPAATAFRPVRAATARTVRSARGAAAGSPAASASPSASRATSSTGARGRRTRRATAGGSARAAARGTARAARRVHPSSPPRSNSRHRPMCRRRQRRPSRM